MEDLGYKIILGIVFLIPFLVIYANVREHKIDKKSKEVSKLLKDIFYWKEMEIAHHSNLLRVNALEKVKAICDHLGVETEIKYGRITPSIEIIRSLSFMKEYLPEIDEQAKIYEENDGDPMITRTNDKYDFVKEKIELLSVRKWNRMSPEQKREMIQKLADVFECDKKEN